MRTSQLILIILITVLFEYNYEITNYYKDNENFPVEWWDFRFKIYSVIFMLLALTVFIGAKGLTKIMTLPLLGFTIDDVIDRTVFNSPTWHWTDYILIVTTVFVMVMLIYNYAKPPGRINKGFY